MLFLVNLDPVHTQSGWTALDLDALGLDSGRATIVVHDLLTDARYDWQRSAQLRRARPRDRARARVLGATRSGRGVSTWYEDAVIYELHVRAFADSDGDGIGDFVGLTQKLDYLQDLGVTAIWLLPFYPSPMRDEGYDISDYRGINPAYGTLRQFRRFLDEAHKRGLRVITEIVLNHTSDQHPWFQRARRAPAGSRYRDWYVWSDDPRSLQGRADHLPRLRAVELDVGPGRRAVLLAPLLLVAARPQLRQPRGAARDAAHGRVLARSRRRRVAARRGPVPHRARRHLVREPAGDARVPEGAAPPRRRALRRPHAARRSEPVARGRDRVLRRRRRVPHGVPLPAHAAPVHGPAHGGPLPDHRHPAPDAARSRTRRSGPCSCATTTS